MIREEIRSNFPHGEKGAATVGSGTRPVTRVTRCEGSDIASDPKDLKYSSVVRRQGDHRGPIVPTPKP
jgi:hypothetical protein